MRRMTIAWCDTLILGAYDCSLLIAFEISRVRAREVERERVSRETNGTTGRTEQGVRPSATRRTNAYQSERCLAHATLQPPYTRKQPPNAPALSARTLTLLVNRSLSPFPRLSTRIHSLEDRGACHLSPTGKKCASSPVPKLGWLRETPVNNIAPFRTTTRGSGRTDFATKRDQRTLSLPSLALVQIGTSLTMPKEQQSKKLKERFLFH